VCADENAAVIAAAPDLLKWSVAFMDFVDKNPEIARRLPSVALNDARRVIAKATGQD
jgi:hypothetical protein